MNDNNNTRELQELRDQITQLRQMLEREGRLNERAVRRAMGEKAQKLTSRGIGYVIIDIVSIFIMFAAIYLLELNMMFAYAWIPFALIAVGYDLYMNSLMTADLFTYGSLVDIARAGVRYKRFTYLWFAISIPFISVWGYLFVSQMLYNYGEVTIGFFVGIVIGGCFAAVNIVKALRTANDIIRQVNELMREEHE